MRKKLTPRLELVDWKPKKETKKKGPEADEKA